MKVHTQELKCVRRGAVVRVDVEDLGLSAGLPEHVLRAIGDAARKVAENFARTGTACGHVQWGETRRCGVMVCEQYVGRHPWPGAVR